MWLNWNMAKITEKEFVKIVDGICEDRESIIKHNPIGSDEEILLWMLMSCLINFLGLTDQQIPCFPGTPTAETYRQAIGYIISESCDEKFDVAGQLCKLS